jgi:FkbM family methyltransferase
MSAQRLVILTPSSRYSRHLQSRCPRDLALASFRRHSPKNQTENTVQISTRYGLMVGTGLDDLVGKSLTMYGEWAFNEVSFLSQFISEGDTVVDVGAYIGSHTRAFSSMVGDKGCVHAFEVNPSVLRLLDENVSLAKHRNIRTYGHGLGRKNNGLFKGIGEKYNTGHFVISEYVAPEDARTGKGHEHVTVSTLDNLHIKSVNFIKIDVEGCELDVLKGALATIAKNRPVIFCESSSLEHAEQLFNFAKNTAYASYYIRCVAFNENNYNLSTSNFFGDAAECGMLLIPLERDDVKAPQSVGPAVFCKRVLSSEHLCKLYQGSQLADLSVAPQQHNSTRKLLIAVSLYKTPDLVGHLMEGFSRLSAELRENEATVLIFNDSPDHGELVAEIEAIQARGPWRFEHEFITNAENFGFVATMNLAMSRAAQQGQDIILLNSDAMLSPGALTEMRKVADLDPMIGFVSPRSNNATIATLGNPQICDVFDTEQRRSIEHFAHSSMRYLPRYTYAPTVNGFCVLIKHSIIRSFGRLDEIYGKGYNEENDYAMRAGRCGFRAALANWAFAFHRGEVSFSQSEKRREEREAENRHILDERYPEYGRLLTAYFGSARYAAEGFLTTLQGPKIRLAIDATSVSSNHNGTILLAVKLIESFSRHYHKTFDIFVVGDKAAFAYHAITELPGIRILGTDHTENFDVALRIGQPFDENCVIRMNAIAPVNIYFMLDTIALDCVHLYSPRLERIWEYVTETADGLIYNSDFTQSQFRRRFNMGSTVGELVSYHSLSPDEYRPESWDRPSRQSHILIVGNHFPHKNVNPTYEFLISAVPEKTYAIIGGSERRRFPGRNDLFYLSGEMPASTMGNLYIDAEAVIFPSFYEGFGFPIVNALAARRPVLAQDNALNRALAAKLQSKNLYLYETNAQLASLLGDGLQWQEEVLGSLHDWKASAREIVEFALERLSLVSIEKVEKRLSRTYALGAEIFVSPLGKEITSEFQDIKILNKGLAYYRYVTGAKKVLWFFSHKRRKKYSERRLLAKRIGRRLRS